MGQAKEIRVAPIAKKDADALIIRLHYSHRTVNNAFLALGVFIGGRLEGAMTFGPSMDKGNILGLVRDTAWNGFLELNRLAFSEALPRNSESRALSIALRMIKKHYPHIEWVISFADGCQCGDGTIYSAAGFLLTGLKLNKSLLRLPDGSVTHKMTQVTGKNRAAHFAKTGGSWSGRGVPLDGYQMRYIYFLNPDARARLVPEEIPYSQIERRGTRMHRGIARGKQATADDQLAQRRGSGDRHAPV
ncbi:hypothetical protein MTX26_24830 [Bradyrhizobium sp. ISRA443]|uniref:Mom family adenine methylcarbamoylation protein n=1 Tax=unclassified Bradyrhizobium TaxID=2631580 RepID=UPI00247B2C35|nr:MULTISPECIES: hypothetical protein [unclassified Bradyrhizobium]WGR97606.1 hypothetical protein MTX23_24825 [Bradyrhizobium sp. ISRA436]WGS04496.1 hypothetical protein MTX18_24830 [Bradyrhizobium sp. ISRA437]WGS11377.1 hypothetical protein MTX26_24830 [Bradyrhizobium sp. ISRA443]